MTPEASPSTPPTPSPSDAPPVPSKVPWSKTYQVTLLRSLPTVKLGGWRAEWELRGARQSLQNLGLAVAVMEPSALIRKGAPTKVLVLANAKNMDKATVLAIKDHIRRGGKVLATYQTSYRQDDNRSWTPNNFALATELGIRFTRWVGGSVECGRLLFKAPPVKDSAVFPESITLLRHQAMLVEALPGTRVIATWDKPEKAAAIVEGSGGIYCGEDLLAPENAQSPLVLQSLGHLLRRLDPGLHPHMSDQEALKLPPPQPPCAPLAPLEEEPSLRIGLGLHDLAGGQLRLTAHQGPLRLRTGTVNKLCRQICLRHQGGKLSLEAVLESKPPFRSLELSLSDPMVVYPTVKTSYLDVYHESRDATSSWQAYRGRLHLAGQAQGVYLINVLPLDAYLAGVVPSEVPQAFPAESLKAMAVVARSYCLSHAERHKSEGFDLCSEVHCQVYRGLAMEAESSNRAVLETLGEVLSYRGKPANTTFHACCGGYGADVEAAWPQNGSVPYLCGKPDFEEILEQDLGSDRGLRQWLPTKGGAYCAAAGRFRWEERIRWNDLESKLEQSLPQIVGKDFKGLGTLKEFRITTRDASGRVAQLLIEGSKGTYLVGGDATRWLTSSGKVGPGGLNSSLFVIDVENTGAERVVRLRGAGWGHGVGLCQEGAAGRARAGQTYRQILQHYYAGTEVSKRLGPAQNESSPTVESPRP